MDVLRALDDDDMRIQSETYLDTLDVHESWLVRNRVRSIV